MTRRENATAAVSTSVLAIGAALVWGAVMLWGFAIFIEPTRRPSRSENLVYRLDGEPLVVSRNNQNYSDAEYRTLEGELVTEPEQLVYGAGYLANRPKPRGWLSEGRGWAERVAAVPSSGKPSASWYATLPPGGDGGYYLEGFDQGSKQRIGYFGQNGFKQARPPESEWFEAVGRQLVRLVASRGYVAPGRYSVDNSFETRNLYLLDGDTLTEVDLSSRKLSQFHEAAGALSVAMTSVTTPIAGDTQADPPEAASQPGQDYFEIVVVRCTGSIDLVDPETGDSIRFAMPAEFQDADWLSACWLGDDRLVLRADRGNWGGGPLADLAWITPEGEITRRETVQLAGQREVSIAEGSWYALAAAPVPMFAPVAVAITASVLVDSGTAADYSSALRSVLADTTPALITVALLGLASAAWVWRTHRKNYRGDAWLWALVALLLGPAGAVGYALHWGRPPRVTCPDCGRAVPRNRGACPACQAEWAPPAVLGIEVLG